MGWSTRWCSNMYLSMLAMVFCGVIRGTIPTEQRMTHNDQWQTVAEKPRVSQTVTSYLPWFAMTKTMRSLPFTMDLPWIYHGFTTISIYFGKTFGSIFTIGKTCWIYHHFTTIFTNMFYHHRGSAIFAARSRCFNRSWQINPNATARSWRGGMWKECEKLRILLKIWKVYIHYMTIYDYHDYIWSLKSIYTLPPGKLTVWPWK